jgi:hypothetical protein
MNLIVHFLRRQALGIPLLGKRRVVINVSSPVPIEYLAWLMWPFVVLLYEINFDRASCQ